MRFLIAGCFVLSCSAASPRSDALTRFTYTEYLMGVDARIVVYAPNKQTAEKACAAAFARIADLDSMMSDYRVNSELMRVCDKAGGPPVKVSPELFRVLKRALDVSRRSDGAFDVTVGPLVRLWRKARKSGVLPASGEIDQARRLVGWQKMILDERALTVRLKAPGMKLDLGGIAKGYADDEAQAVLKKNGISRALVEMGGDIVVSGPPPGEDGWKIRVPNAEGDHGPVDKRFSNKAISTSGDTEQFVVIAGRRYSHVVDPRTGQALTNRVEVTVVARDGLTTDPISTALTVIDPRKRSRLVRAYPGTTTWVRVAKGSE